MGRTPTLGGAPTLTVFMPVSVWVTTAGDVRAAGMYAGRQGHAYKQGIGGERDEQGVGGNVWGYSLRGCL